jgi:hypothetical protein
MVADRNKGALSRLIYFNVHPSSSAMHKSTISDPIAFQNWEESIPAYDGNAFHIPKMKTNVHTGSFVLLDNGKVVCLLGYKQQSGSGIRQLYGSLFIRHASPSILSADVDEQKILEGVVALIKTKIT